MARINLLTIHWGMSYGAVLQTYATCRLLEEAGHEVRVINLMHPKVKNKYLHLKSWKYIFREYLFWRFKNQYFSPMTGKMYSISENTLPDADITIVGSDQVWKRSITGVFGETYYLDFVPDNQRRIALSSSFGVYEWEEPIEYTNRVKMLLERFDAVSVRESSGVKILKDVFKIHSTHLLDPTLAWGKFDTLVKYDRPKDQIYAFLLNNSSDAIERLSKVSNSIGMKIYKPSILEIILKSGPLNWLANIKNSRYVITDSFHGVALSIVFHKEFFVFCADQKKFARIQSLLDILGLSYRYIRSFEDFEIRKDQLMQPIDYSSVDTILKRERIEYSNFICEHID